MNKTLTLLAFLALAALPGQAQRKAKAKPKAPKLTQAEKERAERLQQMTEATQKVVVFDSIVVDKAAFLNAYSLSPEAGRVTAYDDLFHTNEQPNAYAYVNELGNKCYYALEDSTGAMALYTSDQTGGKWSRPKQLQGLDADGALTELNYPYMMADGVTLYFAAKGDEGAGGYDIYVTRYDPSTDSYLKPENIGMPFNSTANDYLYAIDELNNIGWFATDRGQTAGKVCVYLFVPTTTRQTYAADGIDEAQLQSLARLDRMADTWGDGAARDAALARLDEAKQTAKAKETKSEFAFVINDRTTYTRLAQFRSPTAKEKMKKYTRAKANISSLATALQRARDDYATASQADRKALAPEIVQSERQLEQMEAEALQAEKQIRNDENLHIINK